MSQKLILLTLFIGYTSIVYSDSAYIGQLQADVYGTLRAPNNNSYTDVYWVITAPPGLNVYVQLISLQFSGGDFLAAYDGDQVIDQNLIQSSNGLMKCPSWFISSSTNVTIRYAGTPSRSQFHLTYTLPTTASTMLQTTGSWLTFSSPGYPGNYGNNLAYVWILYAPVFYVIEVRFNIFQTEQNADFLTIYDGDSTFISPIIEYSGNETSSASYHIFVSTSNYLTIRFTSSRSSTNSGFVVNYASYPSGESLTTTPPPVSTPVNTALPPSAYCSGNGNYTCNCFYGYTGQNCENEIDFCEQYIDDYKGGLIPAAQLCEPHGYCVSSPQGAICNCSRGFTGQFCENEIANETAITSRCALYNTTFTAANQVPIGCPSQQQVCIPDHINCAVYGSCAKPLGWCIPSATDASSYMTELISLMNTYNFKLF